MADEAVLAELRAIRDLLIMTGGEEIGGLTDGLNEQHAGILGELETGEWTLSGDVLPPLAEEFDVSTETMRRKKNDMLDGQFIEQRGDGQGTEYRKTGLGLAAERANQLGGDDS